MKAIGHVEIQDQIEATRYLRILPLDFKIKANRHPKPAGIFTSPRKKKIRWKLSFTKIRWKLSFTKKD
jgi:hypothetical protein